MAPGVLALRGPLGLPRAPVERPVVAVALIRPEPQRRELPSGRPDPPTTRARPKEHPSTGFRFEARLPRAPIEPVFVGRGPVTYNQFGEPTASDHPPALLDLYA
jgi:hypothetical protein